MNPQEFIPKFYKKLFRTLCRDELYHELAGDLEENFAENIKALGTQKARSIYKKEVLQLLRPSVLSKLKIIPTITPFDMLKNYLKVSVRNIWRDKEHSFISIIGLAAGIVASILVFQYAAFEESYDSLHDQSNGALYRVSRESTALETQEIFSRTVHLFQGFHPAAQQEIPEVISSTHVFPQTGVFQRENQSYAQDKVHFTTASFFDIFSFPLISGDPSTLDAPGSVFLSESYAQLIFGNTDPIGESLTFNSQTGNIRVVLQVRGVFKDIPKNSHIQTHVLMSMTDFISQSNFGQMSAEEVAWRWLGFHTYIRARRDVDIKQLSAKLDEFIQEKRAPYDQRVNRQTSITPHAIEDIHFIDGFRNNMEPIGDRQTVTIFRMIGILTIILAWVNFLNLSSAKSVKRAREIGVRKALGAVKKQLVFQFLVEALLVNFLALALAIGSVILITPQFHQLVGSPIFDYFMDFQGLWIAYLILFVMGAIASGLYPALVLTRFQPIKVLRGNFQNSTKGIGLRKALMFFQFSLVLVMLSGIGVISSQVIYMMQYDIGMNTEEVLVVRAPPSFLRDTLYTQKIETFSNQLGQITGVRDHSLSSFVPGIINRTGQSAQRLDQSLGSSVFLYRGGINAHFLDFYGMDVIAGDAFNESLESQGDVVVINERVLNELQFTSPEEALGKHLVYSIGDTQRIVGVIADFHHLGMKSAADPIALTLNGENDSPFVSIRVNGASVQQTVTAIEDSYESFFPGIPFESFFVDQAFNEIYESDRQFTTVLRFFTIVAIFISCLGVFGLSSYLINQKSKEVSIRKILGAGTAEVISVFTKEYFRLILVSTLVAVPLAYFIIDRWLNTFEIRINMGVLTFLLPLLGLVSIVLLTVGNKTWKAVRANPSNTLNTE